jgi:hypothetical protein
MSEVNDNGLNFQWGIRGLRRYSGSGIQNAVTAVSWVVTGTNEDGISAEYYGDSSFDISSINNQEFIPYENLTEEIVLNWVKGDIDLLSPYWNSIIHHISSEIQIKIEAIVNVDENHLPWKSNVGEDTDIEIYTEPE